MRFFKDYLQETKIEMKVTATQHTNPHKSKYSAYEIIRTSNRTNQRWECQECRSGHWVNPGVPYLQLCGSFGSGNVALWEFTKSTPDSLFPICMGHTSSVFCTSGVPCLQLIFSSVVTTCEYIFLTFSSLRRNKTIWNYVFRVYSLSTTYTHLWSLLAHNSGAPVPLNCLLDRVWHFQQFGLEKRTQSVAGGLGQSNRPI